VAQLIGWPRIAKEELRARDHDDPELTFDRDADPGPRLSEVPCKATARLSKDITPCRPGSFAPYA
ncbi:MAG: hypothetical protein PVG83_07655, partial [Acidimicrobiia bacterium]